MEMNNRFLATVRRGHIVNLGDSVLQRTPPGKEKVEVKLVQEFIQRDILES
jgi:uroporphyrinogen-III decarboxylase